jgi:dihydroflavonol-4-reductase
MKPTLVTGASGFVGWHVARLLQAHGHRVRAMARRKGSVRELDVELAEGDLCDPASLARAVTGCGVLFHVAADYRLWVRESQPMYRANVDGTRALLEAARKAGVERAVYTSTVGCIGFVEGGLGDETTPVSLADMTGHYKRSKWLAEQSALEAARDGFPVVIVNPTAPVGDHDFKPTPTGKTIVDFLKGDMPAYVDTGLNVVDVQNVAEGHLLACDKGRPGERYILGGENMTLRGILETLSSFSGVAAPKVRLPWLVAAAAGAASTGWAAVSGQAPRVPLDAVRMAKKKMWVTHAKAEKELGYRPGPAAEGLRRAAEWFRAEGYC